MKIKSIKEADRTVDSLRSYYRNYINRYCDLNGSMRSVSLDIGNTHDYIKKILDRDNFMALKRLANKLNQKDKTNDKTDKKINICE